MSYRAAAAVFNSLEGEHDRDDAVARWISREQTT